MAAEEVNNSVPPQTLPPYPEMILEAIAALNEKNGSSKTSISKYMESKYGEFPAAHTTILSHHLNKMKDSGELVFSKNNYMKPDPSAPPKRGRGRPPKPKIPLPPGTVLPPARPRGRPRKDPNAPPRPYKPTASGKRRGRPRKTMTTVPTTTKGAPSGRPRGRPPKAKSVTAPGVAQAASDSGMNE